MVALVFGLMLCPLLHLLRMKSKVLRRTSEYWFKELNTDGSGALTKQDFKAFLESKLELNKDDILDLIDRADSNGDDRIGACVRACVCVCVCVCVTLVCREAVTFCVRVVFRSISQSFFLLSSVFAWICLRLTDLQEFEVFMREARAGHRTDIHALVVRDVMMVVILFHPFVSKLAMKAWDCKKVTSSVPGELAIVDYLATDMTIRCFTSSNWIGIAVFSGATLLLFSIGAPAFLLLLLHRNRHKLGEKTTFKR